MIAHWPARGTSICVGDRGDAGCPEQRAPEQGRRRSWSTGVDALIVVLGKSAFSTSARLNSNFDKFVLAWT